MIETSPLMSLSRLFSYPEEPPRPEDLSRVGWEEGLWEGRNLSLLQAEYVRLFINALPELSCPPYGSFYLEGLLMGASTVMMRNLYLDHGFACDELADHIAVEFEFLAFLTRITTTDDGSDDYQLVLDHLRDWLPPFFERVKKNDRSGLYRVAADYARELIGLEETAAPVTPGEGPLEISHSKV